MTGPAAAARPVAVIEPVGGHGGMNFYDFGLAGGLVDAGVQVLLYTCDETTVPDGLPFEVLTPFRAIYGSRPRWQRAAAYFRGLLAAIRDARRRGARLAHFHLFHSNWLEWASTELARLHGMRIVVTAHDIESFVDGSVPALARRIFGAANHVVVHNRASLTALRDKVVVPDERVSVIPHGDFLAVAADAPARAAARERLALPADDPCVLFFGQIKQVKGLDLLLRAFPAVLAQVPRARLVVAGKPWKQDFREYQALIDTLGIAERVTLDIRYVPDELALHYYRAADLVVLPYRRIYQSGVLLMAMSLDCPVLVSDLPAMLEVVEDGRTGFVFPDGDSARLGERIGQLLGDVEALHRVGSAAREHVAAHHDWRRIGALTAQAYRRAEAPDGARRDRRHA